MNQRVDDLAKQCWSHYIDGTLIDGHLHFDHRKFAELIVRECAETIKKDMELAHIQLIPLDFKIYANGRLLRTIREHFGVEE